MPTTTKKKELPALGKLLRSLRSDKRLSQAKLSQAADYDYNIATHWEAGSVKMKPSDAEKIIEAYDLPEDFFDDFKEEFLKEEEAKPNRGTRIDKLVNENIYKLRLAMGLNKKELAEEIKMVPSHLSRIEGDVSNPTIDQLRRFKKVFKVTWDELLDGKAPSGMPIDQLEQELEEARKKIVRMERTNEALLDQLEELKQRI